MSNDINSVSNKIHIQNISDLETDNEIESLSRRSLISWMGNASVIALTSPLLIACAPQKISRSSVSKVPPDTTLGAFNFPFSPSSDDGPIYMQWWGNTVDQQNLEQILTSWQLSINGLVEEPQTLSFNDLLTLPRQNQVTDFHCVEGWSVLDVPWNGLHLSKLIDLVRPKSEATHITLRCFGDIYTESLPLSVALESRSLLAYGIGGATLPLTHGFPLRLIIPRMYGYKSAKWVKEIEFTNASIDGYWEQRGYSTNAQVKASRLREGKH